MSRKMEVHTPFKSRSHIVLIVVGMLCDSESNNERKLNDNEWNLNQKACYKHGLLQSMCNAYIDIIQAHQGCTDHMSHTEAISNMYIQTSARTYMNIVTQVSCMRWWAILSKTDSIIKPILPITVKRNDPCAHILLTYPLFWMYW